MAVSQTKAQLKKVEKKVVVVTYPKGVYKSTLKKNLAKNVALLGGKSKSTTKEAAPKKAIEWTPARKKAATAQLLVVVNRQEATKTERLTGIEFDKFGNMKWKGKKYTYSVKPYRHLGKGPVLFNVRVD